MSDADFSLPTLAGALPRGEVELLADSELYRRVIRDGALKAKASVDILTANLKAVLTPDPSPPGNRVRRAPSIIDRFGRMTQRGVEVRILHADVPSQPARDALRKGNSRSVQVRRCPRLHAKAIVIDARAMYLGSANLTGAGIGARSDAKRNFEFGIWTESPELIDAVMDKFNRLWEGGLCAGCGLRDICPEPLEEPPRDAQKKATRAA
ncbi:MAG: phospholipase D-like domain-containing protein [Planctomycetota bacterium]